MIKLEVAFELGLDVDKANANDWGAKHIKPPWAGKGQHKEEWQGEQGLESEQ